MFSAISRQPAALAQFNPPVLADDPQGIIVVLFAVLAGIFWLTKRPVIGRIFSVVPALVFCYFVPTALTTAGILPAKAEIYEQIKDFILPASLLLLILGLDLPGIIRLGPKAGIMMLAGTVGVVLGGPIALWICGSSLPPDAWQGMAALSGSWIGGAANYVAIGQVAGASPEMMAAMVIPDVFVANIWMGVLLFLAGKQDAIDRRTGANVQAIRDLERRMTDFQDRTSRIPGLHDLLLILALGFSGSWVSAELGKLLPEIATATSGVLISTDTWKLIIVTTLGVLLSFTSVRNLEGAGASRLGAVMLYLLVGCIGASANFLKILESPQLIMMGFVWMAVHVAVLLTVGWLIRAPIFFVAVASQANIGGAASAPVVAGAFHQSLAPVGALLAIAGYVLGTYAGLICMHLLKAVAGVN